MGIGESNWIPDSFGWDDLDFGGGGLASTTDNPWK